MLQEQLLTAPAVARLLGLHPKTVYELSRQGTIPSVKIGRALRFRSSDLEAWLARASRLDSNLEDSTCPRRTLTT